MNSTIFKITLTVLKWTVHLTASAKLRFLLYKNFLYTIFSMILLVYEIWSSLKKHIYYVESAESLATNIIFIETWSTRIDANEY